MKHKKIIVFILLIFIVYLIYYFNHNTKITYLALGDALSVGIDSNGNTNYGYSNYLANYLKKKDKLKFYTNNFASPTSRISDLLYDLEINQIINFKEEAISLKKCLSDADLITLSIGINDIITNLTLSTTTVENFSNEDITNISKDVIKSLEQLFKELRKYSKKQIIFINYYNPYSVDSASLDRLFNYINNKAKELTDKYNIEYLDIYKNFKNDPSYLTNPTNIYPNTNAYNYIANKIIENYLPNI